MEKQRFSLRMKYTQQSLLIFSLSFVLLFSFSLESCAATDERDPLEKVNRKVFKLNKFLDKYFMRPLTVFYKKATPQSIKNGVSRVISNLNETRTITNDLLQGDVKGALGSTFRFAINTTLGVGGYYEVANYFGLKGHENIYFGNTLAKWGYSKSIYLVLPLKGPSTVRDSIGFVVDRLASPQFYLSSDPKMSYKLLTPEELRVSIMALDLIKVRSLLLDLEGTLDNAAVTFDEYELIRDLYLQKFDVTNSLSDDNLDNFYED